ncbi:hypothetical protein Hore_02680 [Halothermothrix orenii H 168]|uniref:Uncharacterized protein n=1 Tax=Halothermothrix orenii (strain H 168 / OCM 544 / DSM 9562) TaxID=373903 RepID=B8D160_HALOH|nr:hypothetical protein Hore_02680 [Halothermothrix orenii H 168]
MSWDTNPIIVPTIYKTIKKANLLMRLTFKFNYLHLYII